MFDGNILKSAGLTENETEVYVILLQLNECLASDIARRTKISRPHVYDALNKLLHKGLASYVLKNGSRYFMPTDPNKLLEHLKDQEKILQQKYLSIQSIMPQLKSLRQPLANKPLVEVLEGSEGIKTILNDIIKTGKEMLAFNTLGEEFKKYVPEHFLKRYFIEREKYHIRSRQFYVEGAQIYRHTMVTYKKLQQSFNPVALFVYGNKVVMFVLTDTPLTIRIESKDVAKLYKEQFEKMWKEL
ncbi:MAG: helix-turn-helix domain-containing protein [Candidatus Woesearchaeota archaeon]|nr:helix-turn-helix domain-containing protein [Candidatus Woesearchaeota archaeon]